MIRADIHNQKGQYESNVVFPMSEKDIQQMSNLMRDRELDVQNVYSEYYSINEAIEGDHTIEEFNYIVERLTKLLKTEEDWEKLDSIVSLLGFTRDHERLIGTVKIMEQYEFLRGVENEEELGIKYAEMNGGIPKWLEKYIDTFKLGIYFYLKTAGEFTDYGFIYKKEASNG
ncbi:MAG: hypothetical protein CVV52_03680 [Spirochaetae bacterium HGW-Spirochaetae-8]|jgi:hypothetical protein|nr:MAG: hypothetical protein CVV52_03680 [Spirochaetae bacterium HGW-Spirochaetae-8]